MPISIYIKGGFLIVLVVTIMIILIVVDSNGTETASTTTPTSSTTSTTTTPTTTNSTPTSTTNSTPTSSTSSTTPTSSTTSTTTPTSTTSTSTSSTPTSSTSTTTTPTSSTSTTTIPTTTSTSTTPTSSTSTTTAPTTISPTCPTNGPYSNSCLQNWWREAGCTTTIPSTTTFWNGISQQAVKNDMALWANTEDQTHVEACYGMNLFDKYPSATTSIGCVANWQYGENGPVVNMCGSPDGDMPWCMLPAYRSGSPSWSWKYTNDAHDPQCLRNWTYYDSSNKVIQSNIPSITTIGDNRSWCPINKFPTDNLNIPIHSWEYCENLG